MIEFCRVRVHPGCNCVRPPGHDGDCNCLYRFPDAALEGRVPVPFESVYGGYCEKVPGLICGRERHDDCRDRALTAIGEAREEAP